MIVGVDTRQPTRNKTGIAYILDNILPMLVNVDKVNQYKFFGVSFGLRAENIKVLTLPKIIQRGVNFLWKVFFFPSANILLGKTDCFFFTNFVDFPISAKKKILMIADLSFIKHPQFSEKKNREFLIKNVGSSIARANKILTISENAKREIADYYKTPEEKIEVICLGCPKSVSRVDDKDKIEKTKKNYGIKKNYILFVGTLEPRKNIEGLVRAYSLLSSDLKNKYCLVICGGKGWYYDKIFKLVNELRLGNDVIFTGYISEQDISSIYSGASLFVFPSFYEGFGLPVLEAFACGIPVVLSHNSSLPEVGGDAVIYCDAEREETIKEGIESVLTSDRLRCSLIEGGYQQLKKFSWDKAVDQILDAINN